MTSSTQIIWARALAHHMLSSTRLRRTGDESGILVVAIVRLDIGCSLCYD